MTTTTKSLHPLILAAAVAVVLFCGVGTAALLGWLPTSDSREAAPLSSAASSEQLASRRLPAAAEARPERPASRGRLMVAVIDGIAFSLVSLQLDIIFT